MSDGRIGVTMNTYGTVLPKAGYLASLARRTEISFDIKPSRCYIVAMLQRTTISLNRNYLDNLKILAVQKQKKLSELVNEAVRIYLSSVKTKKNGKEFFENLDNLKSRLKLNKAQLKGYISKGRL